METFDGINFYHSLTTDTEAKHAAKVYVKLDMHFSPVLRLMSVRLNVTTNHPVKYM